MKESGGAASAVTRYICDTSNHLGLFKPYQSGSDFYERTTSILTAPISAAGAFLFLAAANITRMLESMTQLFMLEPMTASSLFVEALLALPIITLAGLMVVLSPVINIVDLIGSSITTLLQDNDFQESEPENRMAL